MDAATVAEGALVVVHEVVDEDAVNESLSSPLYLLRWTVIHSQPQTL